MQKFNYKIEINAPRQKVWAVLLEDKTYREWVSVFYEGSYAVSDWNEGSKILFLGPNESGMFSVIQKKIPNEFISFKHLGMMKEGKEQPMDEETKHWSGATENYALSENNGLTTLSLEMDMSENDLPFFAEAFEKGFAIIKKLAEN